ncbi:hypothetical protein HER39_05380, partial [Arthrobacter deserti]|nr:hypothetical protein [Arthrobacter deserti]
PAPGTAPAAGAGSRPVGRVRVSWQTRAMLAGLLLVLVVVAGAVLSTVLPPWWAGTIGSQVRGDPGAGILAGMSYGFIFTLAPLLVAWQLLHPHVGRPWKAALAAAALLLAAPNLLTAGVALDSSDSARQARGVLGLEAAWFLQWTLYSAVAAVLVFMAVVLLRGMWRRRGRELEALRAAGRGRTRQSPPPAGPGPDASGGTSAPSSPGLKTKDPFHHRVCFPVLERIRIRRVDRI